MFIFLTYDIKNYYLSSVISFIFDILHRIMTFSERHSVFFMMVQVMVLACELSQPMGRTDFSSTAKTRTNSVS